MFIHLDILRDPSAFSGEKQSQLPSKSGRVGGINANNEIYCDTLPPLKDVELPCLWKAMPSMGLRVADKRLSRLLLLLWYGTSLLLLSRFSAPSSLFPNKLLTKASTISLKRLLTRLCSC